VDRFFAEEASFHFSEDYLSPAQVRFFAEEDGFFQGQLHF